MDLGFNLAQSNRDLKDPTSRQNFGDTSGLLCKNDLIPCRIEEKKGKCKCVLKKKKGKCKDALRTTHILILRNSPK